LRQTAEEVNSGNCRLTKPPKFLGITHLLRSDGTG
jgi:hypothetical protein